MGKYFIPFAAMLLLASCQAGTAGTNAEAHKPPDSLVKKLPMPAPAYIGAIALPAGYTRLPAERKSFAAYLRNIPLKKDRSVYLYNGKLKANQLAQYAVLDVSVGNKDLQQCADAVMRLRAEWLYSLQRYAAIVFYDGNHKALRYIDHIKNRQPGRENFIAYMEQVFSYCGTASLPYSVQARPMRDMQIGDIFLKPGSPGHAVIIADMAVNGAGDKIYLLAQSYMPAQDIHVLNNPMDKRISPWYILTNEKIIETPEWTFYNNQLYAWQ